MLLTPFDARFTTETVFATLFVTAASPVSWSAATPTGFAPVLMLAADCWSSSTIEALLLWLLATTALCRRGSTATPSGLVPTATVAPVPVERSINATVLHPDNVTAAMFCTGSTATPSGSGGAEHPVDTSILCVTVKSEALLTAPDSSTSTANRRAEVSEEGSTVAVNSRSLTNVVARLAPSRRTTEELEKPLPITVRGGLSTLGGAALESVEFTTNSLGLVSVMESG